MSVAAQRTIVNVFTGDVSAQIQDDAVAHTTSPGQISILSLSSGANTITPPYITAAGVTIIPPSGNTVLMTLKGITGDTGVKLHLTDPSSIGLSTTQGTFVITAALAVAGVRFIWS